MLSLVSRPAETSGDVVLKPKAASAKKSAKTMDGLKKVTGTGVVGEHGVAKKRKMKSGTRALRDIKKLQKVC
jgi:hypothetical protein